MDSLFANKIGDGENEWIDNLYGEAVKGGTFFSGATLMIAKVLAETTRLDAQHAGAFKSLTDKLGEVARQGQGAGDTSSRQQQ